VVSQLPCYWAKSSLTVSAYQLMFPENLPLKVLLTCLNSRRARAFARRRAQDHIRAKRDDARDPQPNMANRVTPTPLDADNPAGSFTLAACSERLARRCPQIPCRHGSSRTHLRCRIYDCKFTRLATTIDQSLPFPGGVHVRVVRARGVN
jgi:hypothetical protein